MFKARELTVSNCEKNFLTKCLADSNRLDGRAFDEFRELKIDFGKDWGCCNVSLGDTRVLAQVSCEIQQPKSSRPSEGILNINLELNPLAAPYFEPGRQSELSVQLNRLLEKCIKDSKTVDLESLCIKMNEKVWAFRVDLNVINHDGNILDCASVAALCALAHFRRPDVTCNGEEFIIHSYRERDPIPTVIHHYPVCVSYGIFNNSEYILADSSLLEENVADASLTVGLNAYKELCALHLSGKAELNPNTILTITSKAASRASTVVEQIKSALQNDTHLREQKKSIGFHNLPQLENNVILDHKNLVECLDRWSTKKSKKSAKNKKNVKEVGTVETLGKCSAVLIPNESSNNAENVWSISSEDEIELDMPNIEKKTKKVTDDEVMTVDSNSEEEETLIFVNND